MSELARLIRFLDEHASAPLDPLLIRQAERKDLPVRTVLELGRGAALTAVLGEVKSILRDRKAAEAP